MDGREVASIVTDDDVAVENSTYTTGRRGVAGTLIVKKMVGAAAEIGAPLSALKALGDDVNTAYSLNGRGADAVHRTGGGTRISRWQSTKWRYVRPQISGNTE